MKILFLDIETAPNIAHVWNVWQENIGINQMMDASYVLCWAASWLGSDDIFFESIETQKSKTMLKKIHVLLDAADVVVHYNGSKFDIPTLNKEFLEYGFNPPAPYKQIDLLRTVRSQFRFPFNKLEYVAKALDIGDKIKHGGHELWVRVMSGDSDAWMEMQEYNVQDVRLLKGLYYKVLPWIKGHPNHGLFSNNTDIQCPQCGSDKLQRRGTQHALSHSYQRYQCTVCGSWCRSVLSEKEAPKLVVRTL